MEKRKFLIPFLAALTFLLVGFVSADDLTSGVDVEFNGIVLEEGAQNAVAGFSGEVVPVEVFFTAKEDSGDVKIELELYSGSDDVEVESRRFNVVEGVQYRKVLSMGLPSDLDEEFEDLTLRVRIVDADHSTDDFSEEYEINMQRESYELDVLSVDYNSQVSAGEVLPVVVVVKNRGFERVDDNYVVVSIPELGVSARGYLGDLIPNEDCDDDDCDDEEDSAVKTVYLRIPSDADAGSYDLEVRAYNRDSETVLRNTVDVGLSVETRVFAGSKSKDIEAGESETYDLLIVNSGSDVGVYELSSVAGTGLVVSTPSVVTVGPESSTTVPVSVSADDDLEEGTYTFTVNVDGQQVVYGANVLEDGQTSTSVVALTVVLVIVFVVLLAILIVLLTRKDSSKVEEVETSYY